MSLTFDQVTNQIRDLLKQRYEMTKTKQGFFLIMEIVVSITGVTEVEILSDSRDRRSADARKMVAFRMFHNGYSRRTISKMLNRSYCAVTVMVNQYAHLMMNDYECKIRAKQFDEAWKACSDIQ